MNSVFNSPLELGMRMVYLLYAMNPRKADVQRLVYFDYAAIYSADLGGPSSLHTPVPLRGGEYTSRREVIEDGLYLMASRSFIEASADENGISYSVGENGPSLVGLIGGQYSKELALRCKWVADNLGDKNINELERLFGSTGALWGAEFVTMDRAAGIE